MEIIEFPHLSTNPNRVLVRQKRVIAEDYPFFLISVWKCSCGCDQYWVTLQKQDLGYTKTIFDVAFHTPLEAFLKMEKTVEECHNMKYNMRGLKEGEVFM